MRLDQLNLKQSRIWVARTKNSLAVFRYSGSEYAFGPAVRPVAWA